MPAIGVVENTATYDTFIKEWNGLALENILNMKTCLTFIEFSTGIIIFQESDHDAIHAAL